MTMDGDLEGQLGAFEGQLERVMNAYKNRMGSVFKTLDLTPPQFWALMMIVRAQRIKMSPLADSLGLSMGAASTLIDRLVTRGLVVRDTDAADRRAVYVTLSEKGQAIFAEAQIARRAIAAQAFTRLSPEDRAQLVVSVGKLADAWDAVPLPPGGLDCCAP